MPDPKNKEASKGYGRSVPPLKEHVLIWFLHMDAPATIAMDFWHHFESRNWCNNKGKVIKDWKMRAWEWLWAKA